MGRKARKTRWRALSIDEQSDSEESNTTDGVHPLEKSYQNQKPFYSRFTFSSQSTPTRRYNHDIKSTRSSSTASETKVTFNEDEYTRITTPRQDVLFKKGYLNKPKTYQTQTSTGTSTNSTGNSTGNGTPDHQSADGTEGTDLEYESQFVFPNGFVDQNGIYYVNSYEPYPLVVYNAPVCYPDYSRPKRYSTGSLTESASPNNEENSQSGGEANGGPEFNQQVYNLVYQGYYYGNGTCQPNNNEAANVQCESDEPRRVKKKRRRKLSQPKSSQDGTASEYTDEGEASCDDEETPIAIPQHEEAPEERVAPAEEETKIPLSVHEQNGCDETKCDDSDRAEDAAVPKFDLKPDAEEFIPQAYRNPEPPPGIQFVNFPPSFVPIPIMGEIPPPQYPPPFLPPGIPINFVPPNAKIVPNFVNFVATPNFVPKAYPPAPPEQSPVEEEAKEEEVGEENKAEERLNVENKQHFVTPNEVKVQKIPNKTDIDIEKIVSKLEEAAKEQRMNENKRQNFNKFNNKPRYHHQDNRQNQHKTGNFKRRENDQERFSKNRNFVRKTNEHIHSKQNHVTDPENSDTAPSTPRKAATQNYSATLKRCPRFERHQQQGKVEEALQEPAAMVQTAKKPPAPTQWISVASRKKRKNNKGVSESEEAEVFQEEETEATLQEDGFESYDPNQLVDVVPPTQVIEIVVEPPKVEESDIPKEAIVSVEEETVKPSVEVEMPKEETDEKKEEEEISKPQEEVPPKTVTRKAKKKLQTKRIIIKDTYMVTPEVTEPKKPEVAKKEEAPPPTPPVEVEEDTKQITTSDPVVTAIASESPVSTPEKRTKRKKKKPAKLPSVSVSSSNTTLNNLDDSYDFLLEPSVLDESEDKTNVEISQELDRLIQKGMYNNLEEKIKSLNVSFPNDNFFSSINLTSPLTFEKNNFLKANDFASLLKPTTNLLTKPKEDFGKLNIDFSRIKIPVAEPQPSTSKTGIFLENPEVNEILKNTGNEIPKLDVPASLEVPLKKSKSTGKLKNKSKKQVDAKPEGEEQNKTSSDSEEKTKLYPITQAVKNWMTKTRENTPEVDILKSPKTIKKELCEVCEDEAKVVAESEEEVVLFPKEDWEGSVEQDLLDCWENDPKLSAEDAEKPQEEVKLNGNFVNGTKKLTNGKTSEDEEVLEIYESKYGKNEDFLKLQAEIDEKKRKLNGNFPKHGNLPYRAICCSIM